PQAGGRHLAPCDAAHADAEERELHGAGVQLEHRARSEVDGGTRRADRRIGLDHRHRRRRRAYRRSAAAPSSRAGFARRAGLAVVAGRAVRLGGVRALPAGGIADAGVVALIPRDADDRLRAGTDAGDAGIRAGAGVAVIAGRAVRLGRGAARPGGGVAGACVVALVRGGADDGVAAGADAGDAGIPAGAGVAVVARSGVGGMDASPPGAAVIRARVAVVAGESDAAAHAVTAGVVLGACVAVVARGRVGGVEAAAEGVTAVVGAGVVVVAPQSRAGVAGERLSGSAVAGGRIAGLLTVAHIVVGTRSHVVMTDAWRAVGPATVVGLLAEVSNRARVVVVAVRVRLATGRDRLVGAAADRLTAVHGAPIPVVAVERAAGLAHPGGDVTGLGACAHVVVIAIAVRAAAAADGGVRAPV